MISDWLERRCPRIGWGSSPCCRLRESGPPVVSALETLGLVALTHAIAGGAISSPPAPRASRILGSQTVTQGARGVGWVVDWFACLGNSNEAVASHC